MVVDDEIANSQQIIKERPHRHNNKPNVNDAGEILLQSMLKIQLRDIASINAKNPLWSLDGPRESNTVDSMENKVNMGITTIQRNIDIPKRDLEWEE